MLVCPPVGVSTADVYRRRDPARSAPADPGRSWRPSDAADPDDLGRSLFNRLQPVAEALRPALVRVRDALADLGPSLDGHLMSGSGSAYFGLAATRPRPSTPRTSLQRSD